MFPCRNGNTYEVRCTPLSNSLFSQIPTLESPLEPRLWRLLNGPGIFIGLSILAGDFGKEGKRGHLALRQGLPPLHPAFTLKDVDPSIAPPLTLLSLMGYITW